MFSDFFPGGRDEVQEHNGLVAGMFLDSLTATLKAAREHRCNKAMMESCVPGAATSAYLGTKRRSNALTANKAIAPGLGRNAIAQGRKVVFLREQRQSRVDVAVKVIILTQQGVPFAIRALTVQKLLTLGTASTTAMTDRAGKKYIPKDEAQSRCCCIVGSQSIAPPLGP